MDNEQFRTASHAAIDDSNQPPIPPILANTDINSNKSLRHPPLPARRPNNRPRLPPSPNPRPPPDRTGRMVPDPSGRRLQDQAGSDALAIPELHGVFPRHGFVP